MATFLQHLSRNNNGFDKEDFNPLIANIILITCYRQTTSDADNEMRPIMSLSLKTAALRGRMKCTVCQYNPVPLIGGFTVKGNSSL